MKIDKDSRYIVIMPDGSQWSVPVELIAENRAKYYAGNAGISMEASLEETWELFQDEFEISDWAKNNMDWKDVSKEAEQVVDPEPCDYEAAWSNADWEVEE